MNAFGALISVIVIKHFGRKTLLTWGYFLCGVAHLLVGIFNILEYNNEVIGGILLFLFFYELSSGPIAWLYAVETVIDSALGICLLTLYGVTCILSQVCPLLMNKNSIGPSNMFFILAALSWLGAVYCYVYLKET